MYDSFVTQWSVDYQAPLSGKFPKQEYWSGLPFPSPGYLSNPGIEPESPVSPAFGRWILYWLSHQESPKNKVYQLVNIYMKVKVSVMSDSLRLHGLRFTRLLCPWNSPGKNSEVGCHLLLQGYFPTQGSNPGFLYYRQILYRPSHQGSPFLFVLMNCFYHL